jgi:phage head maturation protease
MKIYLPIAKIDAEKRMVYGYASTEARDDQGEIVKREALQAALGDYMKFGNVREMHQLSAVGKAKNAEVDEKGLYLGAKVVDDRAWEKVVEGVYSGYSIGGKVTAREPADYKTITGLRLDEISLVDRPANPEAVFDCWKRSVPTTEGQEADPAKDVLTTEGQDDPLALLKAAIERVEALVKASDGDGKDDKPYGDVAYADPGYQDDKKKRYPIDSEKHIRAAWNYINKPKNSGKYSAEQVGHIKAKIVAAWKDKIDPKGPPSADDEGKAAHAVLTKHLMDIGSVAQIILQLDWLKDMLVTEAAMEGDDSPQPGRLGGVIDELCGFLNALVAEETAEIQSGEDDDEDGNEMGMAAIASSLRKSALDGRAKAFEDRAQKAMHSAHDQELLDVAYGATRKAAGMDGISAADADHCGKACDAMKAAGARESSGEDSTQDTANNPTHAAPSASPPAQEYRPGVYTTTNTAQKVLDLIEAALGKRSGAHKALMNVAHDCIKAVTDGKTCAAEKAGARHSSQTMGHLQEAHDHVTAAGAKCDAAGTDDKPLGDRAEEENQGTEFEGKSIKVDDLKKMLVDERAGNATLARAVAELTPRLEAIAADVVAIKNTPLPPLTARSTLGLSRIEKGRDSIGSGAEDDAEMMARIARMTPDEQAMLLIKASRMRPIRVPGMPPAAEDGGGQ